MSSYTKPPHNHNNLLNNLLPQLFLNNYSSNAMTLAQWPHPHKSTSTPPTITTESSQQAAYSSPYTHSITLSLSIVSKEAPNESYLLTWPDQMFATTFTMNEYLCWVLVTNRWCCPGGVFILFFITNRLLSASKQFKLVLIAVNSAQNYREWVPQKKTKMIDK